MNIQPIEKRELRADGLLAVHSIFETIQGEGPFCGTPCVFIRLAGCNLQCPACDTDYTSYVELIAPHDIVNLVSKLRWEGLVVISGGEPFRQDIAPLLRGLLFRNYFVQIETNGTLAPPPMRFSTEPDRRRGVYMVCSPKTGKLHPDIYEAACAFKYVVKYGDVHSDGLPLKALDHPSNPYPARPPQGWDRPIYVQPLDEHDGVRNEANIRTAVTSCLKHGYLLQLQVHKYIGVE